MNGKIRLSKSSISEIEKDAVLSVLDKEYLGMGEEVERFEKSIKKFLNTDLEVICVNTGTSALHLALSGLELEENSEVLVPSLTYVASFQAITAAKLIPIACDVNEETLFIDLEDAKKRVTENTKAIMPVHYASSSKGMSEVYQFAKEHNLRVIEDAAQAFGSIRDNKLVGKEGDIICFSFDGIKNITSGEGGAILSSDKNLVKKLKDTRLLGVEKDSERRYLGERSWNFDVLHQGYRFHMSNIMAAIGLSQLTRINLFKRKRQEIVKKYMLEFSSIKELTFLDFSYDEIMPHIFVLKAENRDELRDFLVNNNIECGVHYQPNHMLTKFYSTYSLPITEKIYKMIITIPCHFDLSDKEQNFIIKKVKEFYGKE